MCNLNCFGLNINVSKTKTMIINHQLTNEEYPKTICNLNGKDIENVKVFRYLGSNIKYNEHNTGDEELELRLESAEAKYYEIGKKLFNYKILLKTRVHILNALIRSRLTYGCQVWTHSRRNKSLKYAQSII